MKLTQGAKMPNFTYLSPYREGEQSFEEFANGKRTYVVFLRYYGCTVCRVDMHNFKNRFSDFEERKTNLLVVLQSDPAVVAEEAEKGTFPFEIACDPTQKIYKDFEIEPAKSKLRLAGSGVFKLVSKMNEAKKLGFEHGKFEGDEEQLPAIALVEADGTISYVHYAKNISDMPTVDEMINKL